jgi:hypothetical protein
VLTGCTGSCSRQWRRLGILWGGGGGGSAYDFALTLSELCGVALDEIQDVDEEVCDDTHGRLPGICPQRRLSLGSDPVRLGRTDVGPFAVERS